MASNRTLLRRAASLIGGHEPIRRGTWRLGVALGGGSAAHGRLSLRSIRGWIWAGDGAFAFSLGERAREGSPDWHTVDERDPMAPIVATVGPRRFAVVMPIVIPRGGVKAIRDAASDPGEG